MNKQKVLRHVKKNNYFLSHRRVLIAVSTGLDSMNLLYFLYEYRAELGITIGIAHVNHHQRLESLEEEKFLREWANEHSVPIYVSHFTETFTEAKAREYRYNFFKEIMLQEDYTALVTAHHADDQVETIFMRFIKGKHLKSLTAIKERTPFANGELIRPFLNLYKSELNNVPHYEDSSNKDYSFFRNRTRLELIPRLQEENPKFKDGLIRYSREISNLYSIIDELTEQISIGNIKQFKGYSKVLQYYLIESYLEKEFSLQLSHNQINQIVTIINRDGTERHKIKDNLYLEKDYNNFKIKKISLKIDNYDENLMLEYGNNGIFKTYSVYFSDEGKGMSIPLPSKNPVSIRHRKAGDKIFINGHSKKIRRLLIDEKIPSFERELAVVVEQSNTIIALVVSNRCYLRNDIKDDIMKGILYMEKMEK